MPRNKPGKFPRQDDNGDCLYRSAHAEMDGIDIENRSIPIVLATENPIKTFDMRRMDVVDEVLRIDGMTIPKQIPLVDSHRYESVRNVFGSIRDFTKDGNGRLLARAYFASNDAAKEVFNNYAEGHLQDFSIGLKRESVEYKGNTKIVTRSSVFEGSAAIQGADPGSKALPALRACTNPYQVKEETMNDLREELLKRGMPESINADSQVGWMLEKIETNAEKKPEEELQKEWLPLMRMLKEFKPTQKQEPNKKHADTNDDNKNAADELLQRSRKEILERIEAIDTLCRSRGIEDKQITDWRNSDITVDAIARKILEEDDLKRTGVAIGGSGRIESGTSQREKFYEAARCGLIQRTAKSMKPAKALENAKFSGDFDAIKRSQELVDIFEKPADGHDQFRHVKLNDLARMFLEETGVRDVHRLPSHEIARRALAINDFVQRASDGPAYNTTGSFANLMLDSANKTLLSAYDEALVTYPMWTRQAPSVSDFKNVNRIRFGELSDPEVVPENHEYPEKQTSDARESYAVEKYGELFSISLEAIVNDDLNAISRIPGMQGAAMRRKINKVVYAVLTDNAALSDAVTLFHASSHNANLDTTTLTVAAAVAAMNVGWNVMATQSGLNSDTILNIQPRFLIVPAALSATALTFTGSIADPTTTVASNEDALRPGFTSGVGNIYGPNGPRQIVTVVDGVLDTSSTSQWFLAADPSQVDTVEVTFLQGEESPVLSREEGFTTDTMKYKIRQSFAAAAIDFRGLYQGNT